MWIVVSALLLVAVGAWTHLRVASALQVELAQVIARPQVATTLARSNTSRERALAEVIAAPPLAKPVCRDPDDDAVLTLALAANADLIVSGDNDLLDLKSFQGIEIVAAQA